MYKNIYLFIFFVLVSIFISNTLAISTPSPFINNKGRIPHDGEDEVHHNCIHDQLEEQHFKDKPRLQSDHMLRASAEDVLPTHPIRFIYNTTYLAPNSELSTCYYVNQTVFLGSRNVTDDCATKRAEPCQYTCKAEDLLTKSMADLITNEVLPYIGNILTKYITVSNRTNTNSYRQTIKCIEKYEIDIRNGFTGDFMIYVSAHPTGSPSTVAYATSCITHTNTGAPFLGIINFNPKFYYPYLDPKTRNIVGWNKFLKVAVHEAIHALGFSGSMYSNFKDPSTGLPYTYKVSSTQIVPGTTPSGAKFNETRFFLNTPSVRKFVQKHFACDDVPYGAELENVGGGGTTGSHWKVTRFGEEMMLGYAAPVAPLTGLTLALLNDSGWYGITNEVEEQTIWGKGKGCSFINDFCTQQNWNYPGYWPANATLTSVNGNEYGCSATRVAKGYATWQVYNNVLAPNQQHFNNPSVGGPMNIFDYCPHTIPYRYCFDTISTIPTVDGEIFGPNSACFIESNSKGAGYGCRPQRCQGSTLQFQFQNVWYDCLAGTKVSITNTTTIICPDAFDNTCNPENPSSSDDSSISSSNILQSFNLISIIILVIGNIYLFI